MIPTSSPNAEQRRWLEQVVKHGSVVSREPWSVVVHHVTGRESKHNKVDIGHWFILPLTPGEHDLLHSDQTAFESRAIGFNPVGRWDCEKFLFLRMVETFEEWGQMTPPEDVMLSIKEYHR